jgi:hypothetical protein
MRASLFILGSLGLALVACGGQHSGADTSGLDSDTAALMEDNAEVDATDEAAEVGIEESLSGSTTDPVTLEADAAAEKSRTNPGIFFKPAGCIVSTRAANVVTHVFTDCTGPYGLRSFNGTVTSTWTKIPNGVQVVHATKGFKINDATIDHMVTIQYTKVDGVLKRTRNGNLSGTTAKGRPIKHTASYITTYDADARCLTRNGSAQSSIGLREWSRSITGYERCGIGYLGCPNSGTVKLDGPKHDVTLQFPGGAKVNITVDGKTFSRTLFCNAEAS